MLHFDILCGVKLEKVTKVTTDASYSLLADYHF